MEKRLALTLGLSLNGLMSKREESFQYQNIETIRFQSPKFDGLFERKSKYIKIESSL